MSAELGIGTRVWISYDPESDAIVNAATGTIVDGPHEPGMSNVDPRDDRFSIAAERGWAVQVDTDPDPHAWLIPERRLHPIDDGDPVEEPGEKVIEA